MSKFSTASGKPLAQTDPDSVWEPVAKKFGLTVEELRAQVHIADDIMEKILDEERAAEPPRRDHQYVLVLNTGVPLIIIRVPLKGVPGKFKPTMTGGARNRALTQVMREHGLRQRDILAFDNASHPDSFLDPAFCGAARRSDYRTHHEKLDRAFAEGHGFADFWLYDWQDERGFVLVRRPLLGEGARVVLTTDYQPARGQAIIPAGSSGTVVQMGGVTEERWVVFGEIPVVPMDRAVAVSISSLRAEEAT